MILGESVDRFGFPVEQKTPEQKSNVSAAAEVDSMIISEHKRMEKEKEMNAKKLLEEIEAKINALSEASKEEPSAEVATEKDAEESVYDVVLSDETLDRFADGLLTILGELETEGLIPPVESGTSARDALLAVVRDLYRNRNSLAKMSRKFARFGAKQFLKKQKNVIAKSIS